MEGKSVLIYWVARHLATIPFYCSSVCDQDGARSGKGTLRVLSQSGPTMTRRDEVCTIFSFIVKLKFLNSVYPVVKRVQGKQHGIVSWRKSVKQTKVHSWFIPVNARDVTHD